MTAMASTRMTQAAQATVGVESPKKSAAAAGAGRASSSGMARSIVRKTGPPARPRAPGTAIAYDRNANGHVTAPGNRRPDLGQLARARSCGGRLGVRQRAAQPALVRAARCRQGCGFVGSLGEHDAGIGAQAGDEDFAS